MTDITRLPAADLAAALASGDLSAADATQAHLERGRTRIALVNGEEAETNGEAEDTKQITVE